MKKLSKDAANEKLMITISNIFPKRSLEQVGNWFVLGGKRFPKFSKPASEKEIENRLSAIFQMLEMF